jgi:hypothetical protein
MYPHCDLFNHLDAPNPNQSLISRFVASTSNDVPGNHSTKEIA